MNAGYYAFFKAGLVVSYYIDILLAAYNGEKFISEQIDSLLSQTYTNWRLLIRDDGSKDETLTILQSYQQDYPDKILIIDNSLGNLGPAKSFEYLLQQSDAPHVVFCDQDDIWSPNKLQLQLEAMMKAENQHGCNCPILVHSDLVVIDDKQNTLADSFWIYQKLNPQNMNKFERLLVQNYVTGCTVLINKPLVDLALPIPEKAVMHDWWFALIAMSEGKIINLDEKTIQYRQHGKNDIGAKKWDITYIFRSAIQDKKIIRLKLMKTRDQAVALQATGKLNDGSKQIVTKYIEMFELNWFWKRVLLIRMGFFKYGIIRNLAMFFLI